ncbi:hypothetical protein [Brachybacterium tyrofermentans]|uniref:hypothetical protein n=1 Tax=Brachybacterium tyrofermentans TaxID=47848 RepID=UPI003FD623B8
MGGIITNLLQSHALGIKIVQYIASLYALATLGARQVPGGATTGYELVARVTKSIGMAKFGGWIESEAATTVASLPTQVTSTIAVLLLAGLVFALALHLAQNPYQLTPQASFGLLLVSTVILDFGILTVGHLYLAAVFAFAITTLIAKFGDRHHTWLEAGALGLIAIMSPLLTGAFIIVAIGIWLTGNSGAAPTTVSIDRNSPALQVSITPDSRTGN